MGKQKILSQKFEQNENSAKNHLNKFEQKKNFVQANFGQKISWAKKIKFKEKMSKKIRIKLSKNKNLKLEKNWAKNASKQIWAKLKYY